jgi:YD repeat-containing protein
VTGSTELSGHSVNWSFDGIYRLTGETISGAPSKANGSVSYTLDPVGNRLSDTSTLAGVNSGSFSYNPDDELLSETYDANGNVTSANGNAYQYDSQNELVGMNGGAVRLVYDGDGNRVAKTVNGVTTRYLVDDLNPTGYAQVVEETGAVNRTYTYGLQRISENQIVNNTWTPSFYGYDGNLSGLCVPLCGCLQPMAIPCVLTTYNYAANGHSVSLLYHKGSESHQENAE